MNILFIAHEKSLNGASLSLLGIIDEIADENNIYVLSPYKEGDFVDELKKRNVKIFFSTYKRWKAYKPSKKYAWIAKKILCLLRCQINYISALRLKNVIIKEKIEIIHSNTSVMNIGGILSKISGIPHVWHIREFGEEDFNFNYLYSKKYTLNFMKENSDSIITVSKALYSKYENDLDKNKMTVIYNGVNLKNIYEKDFNISKNNINIIICGAISKAKGQKDAVLAINEIVKRGYNDLTLSIAGNGDTEEIVNLIETFNLSDKIKLLGRVNNLNDIRKDIDLELVCSKCEAFGRVTIEAMMSMIPVIGANTGGTKELIKDGYNGMLYKQGDYLDLADKIEMFMKDRSRIESMGRNAYEFSKKFTAELNASQIYRVYKKIIKNR